MDKGAIIDQCRAIGAESFAANIPEYCGVISVRPSAHVRLNIVEHEEAKLDMNLLDLALVGAQVQNIDAVAADVARGFKSAAVVSKVEPGQVVIDIRHPLEIEQRPLPLDGQLSLVIPFYSLSSRFAGLDQTQHYLLYCGRGVMSQLHAAHLHDQGFTNVGVFSLS
jgi:thiamine biosynthesis protein ThiI